MRSHHPPILMPALLILIATAGGCGFGGPGVNAPTATAQAARARGMATQMAIQLRDTSTVEAQQLQATSAALQSLLASARQSPLMLHSLFDEELGDWPVGDDDGDLASVQYSVSNGKYRWVARAKDSFVWWSTPDMEDVTDFYLSAQAAQISGAVDGEYGLIFRKAEDSTYYLFEVNGLGQFAVYYHEPENWEALIDWTDTTQLDEEGPNRLSLIAQGSKFYFFINDQLVASLEDGRLARGATGTLIGLSNEGDSGTWEFDDFEVRALSAGGK